MRGQIELGTLESENMVKGPGVLTITLHCSDLAVVKEQALVLADRAAVDLAAILGAHGAKVTYYWAGWNQSPHPTFQVTSQKNGQDQTQKDLKEEPQSSQECQNAPASEPE